eukprot:ANDGO_03107.mRNA.1 ciliary
MKKSSGSGTVTSSPSSARSSLPPPSSRSARGHPLSNNLAASSASASSANVRRIGSSVGQSATSVAMSRSSASNSNNPNNSSSHGNNNNESLDGFQILDPETHENRTPIALHGRPLHSQNPHHPGGHHPRRAGGAGGGDRSVRERDGAPMSTRAPSQMSSYRHHGGNGSESGRTSPTGSEVSDWERTSMSSFNFSKASGSESVSKHAAMGFDDFESVPGSPFSISETASQVSDNDNGSDTEEKKEEEEKEAKEKEKETLEQQKVRLRKAFGIDGDAVVPLDDSVTIVLSETGTFELLNIRAEAVPQDSPAVASVKDANKKYAALLTAKQGNDKYSDRPMQTLNPTMRSKDVQVDAAPRIDRGVEASVYDIYDAMDSYAADLGLLATDAADVVKKEDVAAADAAHESIEDEDKDDEEKEDGEDEDAINNPAGPVAASSCAATAQVSGIGAIPGLRGTSVDISLFPGVVDALVRMERVILNNVVGSRQMLLKDAFSTRDDEEQTIESLMAEAALRATRPSAEEEGNVDGGAKKARRSGGADGDDDDDSYLHDDSDSISIAASQDGDVAAAGAGSKPTEAVYDIRTLFETIVSPSRLDRVLMLFRMPCPISSPTKSMMIASSIAFNPRNPNLFAVSYLSSFDRTSVGGVAVFNVKNPLSAERVYPLTSGATCLAFNPFQASNLCVGHIDGTISLIDIRVRNVSDALLYESIRGQGKHTDAVWDVQCRSDGLFVSVSSDGRVAQWATKKGLECQDLMRLKRISGGAAAQRKGAIKSDAFISRHAGGLSLSFLPTDSNIYLASTEDGDIFKCSCSYSEQYLEHFSSHAAPAFRARFNPKNPSYFASVSGDWTIGIWHTDHPSAPIISTTNNEKDGFVDVAWHPILECVLATVTQKGRVDIWNLATSIIDPVSSIFFFDPETDKKSEASLSSSAFPPRKVSSVVWAPESKPSNSAIVIADWHGICSLYKVRWSEEEIAKWTSHSLDQALQRDK